MTIADLRRARVARGLSLADVAERTRIGTLYLKKIEEGKLGALPPGLYARAFLRGYAEAVGLQPDAVMRLLPDELAGPAETGAAPTGAIDSAPRSAEPPRPVARDSRTDAVKRLLERHDAQTGRHERPGGGSAGHLGPRRLLAATFDGVLLASIHVTVLLATSAVCGVSLSTLMSGPGLAVFPLLTLITGLYVFLMGGIAGHTIGAMLLGAPAVSRPAPPMDLHSIARRSISRAGVDGPSARLLAAMGELVRRQRHHA